MDRHLKVIFGTVLVVGFFKIPSLFAQCANAPTIDLGNDTTLCPGKTLQISAPSGFHSYLWSNGQTASSISVSTPGTYAVDALFLEPNLVLNGDFELGNVNFTSAHDFCGTTGAWVLAEESQYAINSSPTNVLFPLEPCSDHTPNGNLMMVVNGSEFPNTLVWSQTIAISPNSEYIFSCWISNVLNSIEVSDLQFFINGVQLGPIFSTSETPCNWTEVYEIWNSGSAISAVISILNQNTTAMGNDFALDDIVFTKVCHIQDEVVVNYEILTVNAGSDLTFCAENPQNIQAVSNPSSAQLLWNTGETSAEITPLVSGTYTVTATSSSIYQCVVSDQVQVNIINMDWNIDELLTEQTSCGLDNGSIRALTSGTFVGTPNYSWMGPGFGNYISSNAPLVTNLASGWYYLTINSNGCTRNDSTFISSSTTSIAAAIDADVFKGLSPLEVNFANNSQDALNYYWNFEDGSTYSTNNLDSVKHTFYHSGYYTVSLIAVGADHCVDTASLSILVTSEFILYVPNAFTPNNDPMNNSWMVYVDGIEPDRFQLEIYNRWGELIWNTNNPNETWDGTYKGSEVQPGLYTWNLECITRLTHESVRKQGFINLIR